MTPAEKAPKAAHLMCHTPLWGVVGFLGCAYLAYVSLVRIRQGSVEWPHDAWSLATYAVWVLLMAGLLGETRCWRERIFFALVLADFTLGFVLGVWGDVPLATASRARMAATGLWALAALAALRTAFSPGQNSAAEKKAN